jgi:hypothetical protein
MKPSINDVEARLRSTLHSVDHVELTEAVVRGRNQNSGARVAAIAMASLAVLGTGWTWNARQTAVLHSQAGSVSVTPYDTVPIVEWERGPLEAEMRTAEGTPGEAMQVVLQVGDHGCFPAGILRRQPEARDMPVREFIERYGTGWVAGAGKPDLCVERVPVPDDVRAFVNDLTEFSPDVFDKVGWTALLSDEEACYRRLYPAGLEQYSREFDRVGRELDDNLAEISAGTYSGLERLRQFDIEMATLQFRCKSETYARRQDLTRQYVAAFTSDPSRARHLSAVRTFVAQVGLDM